jgi:hypothetical protein
VKRTLFRATGTLAMTLAVLVVSAAPAWADPAVPTNYESRVTGLNPSTNVADFEVIGGDSFLQVTVSPGHEVLIPGYFDEPYLRIDADGSVWLNEDSPASYINLDRYGDSGVPEGVDGEGEPRWVLVARDGRYAWHDHRTHWMSPDPPPVVSGGARQLVFPWQVPVIVDGGDTIIHGELIWVPSVSPIPGLLAGAIALLPLTAWKRGRPLVPSIVVGAAALLAGIVILAETLATPADARGFPVWAVYAAVAMISAGLALARSRSSPKTASRANLLAALTLLVWAVVAIEVLWLPILPSTLPTAVVRAGVGVVLWSAAGVIVLSVSDEVGRTGA